MIDLVCVILYSVWLGNLITTLYHRIPNEIPIGPKHKPFCSNCQKPIKFHHYLPLIYYIFSDRHCKHCKIKIPSVYFKMELTTAFVLILYYFLVGFGNNTFVGGSILITASSLLFFVILSYKKIHKDLIWIFILSGLVYRAYGLHDIIENVIMGVLFSYWIAKIIDAVSMKVRHQPVEMDAFRIIALSGVAMEVAYTFIILIFVFIVSFIAAKFPKFVYAFSKKSVAIVPVVVYLIMFFPSREKIKVHIITKPFLSIEKESVDNIKKFLPSLPK